MSKEMYCFAVNSMAFLERALHRTWRTSGLKLKLGLRPNSDSDVWLGNHSLHLNLCLLWTKVWLIVRLVVRICLSVPKLFPRELVNIDVMCNTCNKTVLLFVTQSDWDVDDVYLSATIKNSDSTAQHSTRQSSVGLISFKLELFNGLDGQLIYLLVAINQFD